MPRHGKNRPPAAQRVARPEIESPPRRSPHVAQAASLPTLRGATEFGPAAAPKSLLPPKPEPN
jgi:hypothetical protein